MDKHFDRYGYVQVPVLNAAEVTELRQVIMDYYHQHYGSVGSTKKRYLTASDVINCQKILSTTVCKPITDALHAILGEQYAMFPDFQVQISMYGSAFSGNDGWHIDAGSEVPNAYLGDKHYRFVKCGLYLQDNTERYGGAVDLIPGMHGFPVRTGNLALDFKIKFFLMKLRKKMGKRMPIKSGEFLAFDSRLPHRSSPPCTEILHSVDAHAKKTGVIKEGDIPKNELKIVVYFNACRLSYADSFLENSIKRVKEDELDNTEADTFFSDYLQLTYPNDFPDWFKETLTKQKISIKTIEDADLKNLCKKRISQEDFSHV